MKSALATSFLDFTEMLVVHPVGRSTMSSLKVR